MKSMNDRKMDMNRGNPKSNAFFPEDAHNKALPRAGEISDHKYPDTEEAIARDQQSFVKSANRAKAKSDFRH
jgi:hypothetical protein